jgi:hypothetical protein
VKEISSGDGFVERFFNLFPAFFSQKIAFFVFFFAEMPLIFSYFHSFSLNSLHFRSFFAHFWCFFAQLFSVAIGFVSPYSGNVGVTVIRAGGFVVKKNAKMTRKMAKKNGDISRKPRLFRPFFAKNRSKFARFLTVCFLFPFFSTLNLKKQSVRRWCFYFFCVCFFLFCFFFFFSWLPFFFF